MWLPSNGKRMALCFRIWAPWEVLVTSCYQLAAILYSGQGVRRELAGRAVHVTCHAIWEQFYQKYSLYLPILCPSCHWCYAELNAILPVGGWVMHISISKLGHHWFKQWPVIWPAPSSYLNQWRNNVKRTLGEIFYWQSNQKCNKFHSSKCIWKCHL